MNNMGTTSFNDFPKETTAEILLRLPVKDLIRSTSVSKTWYSLITDPSFISDQIRKAVSCCNHNSLLIIPTNTSHQNYCSLISTDTSSLFEKFDIPFQTNTRTLKLVTEVHRLLLLTDLYMIYAYRELYLWNPYVKTHRVLVSSCFKKPLDALFTTYCVAGMGFDEATNDYKIVRIFYVEDDKRKRFGVVAPKVEIYSLRKNTWRKMKNTRVPRFVYERGVYVNGCYYWLEKNESRFAEANNSYGNKLRIMFFDFQSEVFGEFEVPHDVPSDLGRCSPHKLMQFEDSLALCVLDSPLCDEGNSRFPCCIWLMRQENGVVNWTLRFRALLEELGTPLDITKNEALILEAIRSRDLDVTSIISCDLKTMIHKDHGFGKSMDPDVSIFDLDPSTVDNSFPESLIMYEGGKLLLKYAK
ncbi:F-box/kelch-repeat protein At3g23880-like isoform X1 [Apium graveolens]|uniref:F-box/kelch-repeat protein At3g23880-like isoform X1 n=2 Tax=Apium graveolens TaxID=4045 RepID=UPI003D7B75DE